MQTILSKKAHDFYLITGQLPPMGGGKGGSSGGGGGSTQTVQKADPWEGQQPFLKTGFEAAENRYNSDQPNFYPGNTIAPFNPNETAFQQGVIDYTTGARPANMSFGAESALTGEMLANPYTNPIFNATRGLGDFGQGALQTSAGFTGAPILDEANASPLMQQMLSGSVQQNPFIGQAIGGFANEAVGNFQEQVMPALRASQIAYQPGGSSRGDIAGGIAAGNVGRSIADFANRSYMDAFNSAQQQQMGAAQLMEQSRGQRAQESLGQASGAFNPALGGESLITQRLGGGLGAYPTVAQAPIDMMTSLGDVGYGQREMTQQQLDENVNRYQFEQNIEDQKLQNYMNLIQGNYGGTTTASAERGGLGLAGQLGQGVGGLAALGGLIGF